MPRSSSAFFPWSRGVLRRASGGGNARSLGRAGFARGVACVGGVASAGRALLVGSVLVGPGVLVVPGVLLVPSAGWAAEAAPSAPQTAAGTSPDSVDPRTGPVPASAGVPLAESLNDKARAEYDAARLLFQDGDFAGASAKFHLAYQLSKDPRLLWNQAVCEKEQRHYARATTLIERYLREGSALIDADKKQDAQAILEALRQFSSLVELKGAPPGATVEVDGVTIGKTPLGAALHLDLGRHTLRVEAAGFRPFLQNIEVPGASTIRVPVRLVPELAPTELSVSASPRTATIRVDGIVVGEGSWSGPISPGVHRLQISAPGRVGTERRIEIIRGRQHVVDVQLEQEKKPSAWPWLIAGAIVLVGGAVGGTVWAVENGPVVGPSGSLGNLDGRQPP